MRTSFSLTMDQAPSLVRIDMAGFFLEADARRFVATPDAASRSLHRNADPRGSLVDWGLDIQSPAPVEALAPVLNDPFHLSRLPAFAVGPGLARAQVRRAPARRGARFFPPPE